MSKFQEDVKSYMLSWVVTFPEGDEFGWAFIHDGCRDFVDGDTYSSERKAVDAAEEYIRRYRPDLVARAENDARESRRYNAKKRAK